MPKFHVHCTRHTTQRVVLEVNAVSARHAMRKVINSEQADIEFEEVGFDEGDSELVPRDVSKVDT